MPREQCQAIDEGRLLVLSPFRETRRRATDELAWERNALVATLADEALVIHATAGSRVGELARRVLAWGKPVLSLAGERNWALLDAGAEPVTPERWVRA